MVLEMRWLWFKIINALGRIIGYISQRYNHDWLVEIHSLMQWKTFELRYPETASLLPSNFLSAADPANELRRTIERDRTGFLDIVESLVKQTPAQQIVQGSYRNSLTRKDSFSGLFGEMRGFLLAEEFCNPTPADITGGDGLPDIACDTFGRRGLDIEVTRFANWDQQIEVQEALEDKFNNTPYTPNVHYFDPFNVMPYGYHDIRANEIFVGDIIEKIEQVNPQNPPSVIQNYGLKIELHLGPVSSGMIGTTSVRAFPTDPDDVISYWIREKAEKQRGYRPLIVIVDSQLPFLDFIDLRRILLGTSVTSVRGTDPAPEVKLTSRLWQSYMQQNGVMNIPAGNVGLFAEDEFSMIAGVVFIDVSEECYYIPNCYSNDIQFNEIYNEVSSAIDGLNLSNLI